MITFTEFIEHNIIPALGEYVGDYDLEGIVSDVSVWDDRLGYIMRPDVSDDDFWDVVKAHDKTTYIPCPYCGASNTPLKGRITNHTASEIDVEMFCYQCGTGWHMVYAYTSWH